jgi:hypothetical protein
VQSPPSCRIGVAESGAMLLAIYLPTIATGFARHDELEVIDWIMIVAFKILSILLGMTSSREHA